MRKTMKNLAFFMLAVALIIATSCNKDQPEPQPNNEEPEMTSKTYLGIVGYGNTLAIKDITLLDETSENEFACFIDSLSSSETENNSALLFSEYKALELLQSSIEPPRLNNVSLITVMSRADNSSINSTLTNPQGYTTNDEYRLALNQSITNSRVHGKQINAYTLGLLTNDAQSQLDEFNKNMEMLASREENINVANDLSQGYVKLNKIIKSIVSITGEQNSSLIVLVLDNKLETNTLVEWFIEYIDNHNPTNAQNYVINVSANPTEGGTVIGSGTFVQGQNCIVVAKANIGYIFTNWTDNGIPVSTNDIYTFKVNNNRNLVANFTTEPQQYTVDISANPTEGGTVIGSGTYTQGHSCTVGAVANTGYNFTNWTENDSVVSTDAAYTFTVNDNRSLVANFTVVGGDDIHDYVDLGLPSGTLWATRNVEAYNSEDFGYYFAWGETQQKTNYVFETYKYWWNGSMTKYNESDNLITLQPNDDAATAFLGNGWRMPTQQDWQELFDNTTNAWTNQNGVNGRLFTAANGNQLFLPAAGFRHEEGAFNVSQFGFYWSSSRSEDNPNNAWFVRFNSEGFALREYLRLFGLSVRPVRSPN